MQRASFLNLVPEKIEKELIRIYIDPSPLIALWNRSQLREPYDFGEVEDLFFEVDP
jgi:hypothetical protein